MIDYSFCCNPYPLKYPISASNQNVNRRKHSYKNFNQETHCKNHAQREPTSTADPSTLRTTTESNLLDAAFELVHVNWQ